MCFGGIQLNMTMAFPGKCFNVKHPSRRLWMTRIVDVLMDALAFRDQRPICLDSGSKPRSSSKRYQTERIKF